MSGRKARGLTPQEDKTWSFMRNKLIQDTRQPSRCGSSQPCCRNTSPISVCASNRKRDKLHLVVTRH
jgi:hypothetical protein